MRYAIALLTALGTVYCLVPPIRLAAMRWGFVDRPAPRKIHRTPIPLMGGVAIFLGCVAAFYAFIGWTPLTASIVYGGGALMAVGLVDDAYKTRGKEFPVWPRIIVYTIVSSIPVWFGIEIAGVRFGGEHMWMFGGGWSILATMLWVFALINMMNFIDGVDGLASGIAVISSLTLLTVALLKGQGPSAAAAAVVAGAALGFLAYNFYPAKMFMGDAGATFLGYALAVIAVDGAFKSAAALSLFVPLLAVGVPIMDTAIVFSRRLLSGKGLHRADKLHTHHSLLHWGLNQRQTVSFLYLVGAVFSLLSILLLLTLG
ncbi:undecaprenyl/decaprenyl-phosphate alpha-N-acetylglucosaminyl 1-phosphate transferase [Paenibacillus antri]|uniref:Undecaprenyl/decaprenyl-phosphate alpha-N-acetylglucosaminyl 1-phosphate transferase n=1 Tax=Paenibacillus antri TaxID=2582848 RepID=A0A5R9G0Q8_9BACL|nr:MraY family glycosyltransferase [Paenibacillus antri]TLS49361.1 undecaprenyl/decaprenyl-phosphate alpha-N-acetylglucosaminyl 1-phosphate transferase [Paenibacillus antri]